MNEHVSALDYLIKCLLTPDMTRDLGPTGAKQVNTLTELVLLFLSPALLGGLLCHFGSKLFSLHFQFF